MNLFDLTKDGVEEIIVGRDDGRLNVYTQYAGIDNKTSLAFSKDIGKGSSYYYLASYVVGNNQSMSRHQCTRSSISASLYLYQSLSLPLSLFLSLLSRAFSKSYSRCLYSSIYQSIYLSIHASLLPTHEHTRILSLCISFPSSFAFSSSLSYSLFLSFTLRGIYQICRMRNGELLGLL